MVKITNLTTGATLAAHAEVARTWRARMVGLLGRQALEEGEALILPGCNAIHTIGMRFPIDVLFLRKNVQDAPHSALRTPHSYVVIRAIPTLAPFRLVWALGADTVIELQAGTLARTSTTVGAQVGHS